MSAAQEQHREGVVLDFQPRRRDPVPEPEIPRHLRRPMADDVRRRTAERGIANARQSLARARIRRVPDDG